MLAVLAIQQRATRRTYDPEGPTRGHVVAAITVQGTQLSVSWYASEEPQMGEGLLVAMHEQAR